MAYQITDKTIEIYSTTAFNTGYAIILRNELEYQKNSSGIITITLKNVLLEKEKLFILQFIFLGIGPVINKRQPFLGY